MNSAKLHYFFQGFLFVLLFTFQNLEAQQFRQVARFNDLEAGVSSMTVDDDRRQLIIGDEKGNLYFRDLATGTLQKKIKAHNAQVNTLAFNSTGKLLISSTTDGEIKIFDFAKDQIIQSIYSPDYSGMRFVLFSIADGFIYFNGNNRLYKTRSDLTQKVDKILEETDTIFDAVITKDRSSLIYASGTKLKVMSTRSDMIRQEINSGSSPVERLCLLRDSLLVSWSKDGTISFWTYKYGQLLSPPSFWFKAGFPSTMNFTQDGSFMVSGNIGNWARLWNPFERKIEQELFGHQAPVKCSEFGTDENTLFTGSTDGNIFVWKKTEQPQPLDTVKKVVPTPVPVSIPEEKSTILTTPVQVPEVEMTETNIPKIINGRKVIQSETIEIQQSTLTIYVFDNSFIDGDTMSLFFNGEWLLDHYGVTKFKKPITLNFKANTNNFLVLFANNMGKSPPNTAAIVFSDGNKERYVKLSSDLKTCSALNFVYKK
ncbi:MAG TPA: hypothetical protein PKL85_07290 [Bacteroidia bacterium]|nr:hypothetical protein [Bacteroidia bacterium]